MFSTCKLLRQSWNSKWIREVAPALKTSQEKRFADVSLVERVIELDNEWRQRRGKLDFLNKHVRQVSKWIGMRHKKQNSNSATLPIDDTISLQDILEGSNDIVDIFQNSDSLQQLQSLNTEQLKQLSKKISSEWIQETQQQMQEYQKERDALMKEIGNMVHESVPVSNTEDDNEILKQYQSENWSRLHGADATPDSNQTQETPLLNHVDIMSKLQQMHTERGAEVGGSRAYYLTGDLVRLNMALTQYAMDFMRKRSYTPIQPPYFMDPSIATEVAQLDQFDEELYVVSDGDKTHDKYLIATSEQPLCAFHRHEWIDPKRLPIRYAGYSTCFRKEAGSHGRDTLGIFRVHQFEKVEQFCLTSPQDSWRMMDEMIGNCEEFFSSLGISYRLVNIVSGKLNNAAAKKVDLEAWFPSSGAYRELVSCSNCTDYQSSRLKIHHGLSGAQNKEYVHMLNATLCATTRTMCCLVETHQTPEGIRIPEVLKPYGFGPDEEMIHFHSDGKNESGIEERL